MRSNFPSRLTICPRFILLIILICITAMAVGCSQQPVVTPSTSTPVPPLKPKPELKALKAIPLKNTKMTSMFVFSKDSKSIAVGTGDNLSIWDVQDAFKKDDYELHSKGDSGIQTLSYSSDGNYVYASMGRWGLIDVVNLKDKRNRDYSDDTISSSNHSDMYANTISPDGKTFVYADGETLVFWDYQTKTSKKFSTKGYPEHVQQLAYSPDGKYLTVGFSSLDFNGALTSFEVNETKRVKPVFKYDGSFEHPITFVVSSPDSTLIAFGNKGKIYIRNLVNSETKTINGRDSQAVTSVAYMPSGTYMAVAYNSGIIDIFDTSTYERVYSKECGAMTIAFSPDGNYLAALSKDEAIRFWDSSNFK